MSTTELRELDLWIGERIMKFNTAVDLALFRPTTDPAAAMVVLERCLLQAAASYLHLLKYDDGFSICGPRGSIEAETLPLVICLYAKEMFK